MKQQTSKKFNKKEKKLHKNGHKKPKQIILKNAIKVNGKSGTYID